MNIKQLQVGELKTNCIILKSDDEVAVIDPGDNAEQIIDEVNECRGELKYIILTHYHFDHVLALDGLVRQTKAPVLIHKAEKDFIDFEVNRFLEDGDIVNIGSLSIKVVHTPGHTKGSICLFGDDFVIAGDTLFENGCGRIDLPGGSLEDMRESLDKLDKIIKPDTIIYPGHGNKFTKE